MRPEPSLAFLTKAWGWKMSEGAMQNSRIARRGWTSRWRVAALGSAIVIFGIVVSHANGVPYMAARSAEAQTAYAPPLAYMGALAEPQPADRHAALAEADAARFTGRIGPDLTAALRGAGVPERQGREYVAVLARAIPLAGELSVDDRFDLVIERLDDGGL